MLFLRNFPAERMKFQNTKKYVRFKGKPQLAFFNNKYYFYTPEYFVEIHKK